MTAQPVPAQPALWQGPDLRRQRLANYTIEDVLALPDDAPRVELLDGEYELVAASTEEVVLEKPFSIRLPIRDITP